MANEIKISVELAEVILDNLQDHNNLLKRAGFRAAACGLSKLIGQLQGQIQLANPQTLQEQIELLTDVMGVGPEPEGNR